MGVASDCILLWPFGQVTDYLEAVKQVEELITKNEEDSEIDPFCYQAILLTIFVLTFPVPGTTKVSPKLALPVDSLVTYLQECHGLSQDGE